MPTPAVVATGRYDDWGYLLMTTLPCRDLRNLWPALDQEAKRYSRGERTGPTL